MRPPSGSFGDSISQEFSIGDIVSWTRLGSKYNIGMIYEIYSVWSGGRTVKKARISSYKDSYHYEVLVTELKLVSKLNK